MTDKPAQVSIEAQIEACEFAAAEYRITEGFGSVAIALTATASLLREHLAGNWYTAEDCERLIEMAFAAKDNAKELIAKRSTDEWMCNHGYTKGCPTGCHQEPA